MLKFIQTRLTSGLLEPEVIVAKNYAEKPPVCSSFSLQLMCMHGEGSNE